MNRQGHKDAKKPTSKWSPESRWIISFLAVQRIDFAVLLTAAYGVNALADADRDGDSDGADFLTWQRQFGAGAQPLASSQAIPEPATVAAWFAFLALALRCTGRKVSETNGTCC